MLTWSDVLQRVRDGNQSPSRRVSHSLEEWRALLPADVYAITRLSGTEAPFSSDLCHAIEPGRYECRCCGSLLFDADEKFESGTGWPSFRQPAAPDAIAYFADRRHGMVRIETRCNGCDAHLGHVFPDGPLPTGLRFCINAVALRKQSKD
jgi:peptide-methionine (R)-S-oxide reductase